MYDTTTTRVTGVVKKRGSFHALVNLLGSTTCRFRYYTVCTIQKLS